jgi:hypothetical protein
MLPSTSSGLGLQIGNLSPLHTGNTAGNFLHSYGSVFLQTHTRQLQAPPTTIAVPAWQPLVDETKEGQKPIPCPESWKSTEAGEVRQEQPGCFFFRHAFLVPSRYRSLGYLVCFLHGSFSTGRNKNLVFGVLIHKPGLRRTTQQPDSPHPSQAAENPYCDRTGRKGDVRSVRYN